MAEIDWSFLNGARGVVHIGAHSGQERHRYRDAGLPVLWVEALPANYDLLVRNLDGFPDQIAHNALLTDRHGSTHDFNVSSNNGESSSIFQLARHKQVWPHVAMVGTVRLTSTTFARLVADNGIEASRYDVLVLDVQGAELLVLKGMGDLLGGFRSILAEATNFEAYEGAAKLADLDAFLRAAGFGETARFVQIQHPRFGSYWDVLWQRRTPSRGH